MPPDVHEELHDAEEVGAEQHEDRATPSSAPIRANAE
jgi:hypothetical protein